MISPFWTSVSQSLPLHGDDLYLTFDFLLIQSFYFHFPFDCCLQQDIPEYINCIIFFFIEMLMTNPDWSTMIEYIPPNKSKGGSKRADWSLLWINLKYTCIYTFQDFCIRDQYLNNWFIIISI